jgi:hypothetical protein
MRTAMRNWRPAPVAIILRASDSDPRAVGYLAAGVVIPDDDDGGLGLVDTMPSGVTAAEECVAAAAAAGLVGCTEWGAKARAILGFMRAIDANTDRVDTRSLIVSLFSSLARLVRYPRIYDTQMESIKKLFYTVHHTK